MAPHALARGNGAAGRETRRLRVVFGLSLGAWVLALTPSLFSQQQQGPPPPPPPPPPRPIIDAGGRGIPTVVDGHIVFTGPINRPPRRIADMPVNIPADNPITDEKVALGKRLFSDPILSSDRKVSCATCHIADHGFADEKTLAVGIFDRVGKRHSPALINRVFGRAHFWDGRAATLELQVLQPIADPNEMDLKVEDAVGGSRPTSRIARRSRPSSPVRVSSADLGRALATFLRTIRSTDTPYDRFVDGDTTALTAQQQQGLQIFRGKARCIFCHAEPTFTDEQFQNTGIAWMPDPDGHRHVQGRRAVQRDATGARSRQVQDADAPRGRPHRALHARRQPGDAHRRRRVLRQGRPAESQPLPDPPAIGLTADEKQALIAFLQSLTSGK